MPPDVLLQRGLQRKLDSTNQTHVVALLHVKQHDVRFERALVVKGLAAHFTNTLSRMGVDPPVLHQNSSPLERLVAIITNVALFRTVDLLVVLQVGLFDEPDTAYVTNVFLMRLYVFLVRPRGGKIPTADFTRVRTRFFIFFHFEQGQF